MNIGRQQRNKCRDAQSKFPPVVVLDARRAESTQQKGHYESWPIKSQQSLSLPLVWSFSGLFLQKVFDRVRNAAEGLVLCEDGLHARTQIQLTQR